MHYRIPIAALTLLPCLALATALHAQTGSQHSPTSRTAPAAEDEGDRDKENKPSARSTPRMTIELRSGERVKASHLGTPGEVAAFSLQGSNQDGSVELTDDEVESINVSIDRRENSFESVIVAGLSVTTTDGRTLVVREPKLQMSSLRAVLENFLHYTYVDSDSGALRETATSLKKIDAITFNREKRTAKVNPRTGTHYPPGFRFDPVTGDRLEWSSDGGNVVNAVALGFADEPNANESPKAAVRLFLEEMRNGNFEGASLLCEETSGLVAELERLSDMIEQQYSRPNGETVAHLLRQAFAQSYVGARVNVYYVEGDRAQVRVTLPLGEELEGTVTRVDGTWFVSAGKDWVVPTADL